MARDNGEKGSRSIRALELLEAVVAATMSETPMA